MNALLQAALHYAELGYAVFPCAPGRKTPLTKRGFQEATVDAEQIKRWWTLHPAANVALATAGLVVIDVDGRENAWLADQPEKLLNLAAAPLAITPGGRHYVFRQPEGRSYRGTTGQLAPRVDTRADGGYILVPPSCVAGKDYRWADGLALDEPPESLPLPPSWLVAELDQLAAGSPAVADKPSSAADANAIPAGQRNSTLARLAGAMRRVGMSHSEIAAALEQANADRCVPPLSPAEVARIAASVARYEPDSVAVALAENHWGQMGSPEPAEPPVEIADPGPVPDDLLRIPGFVSEVMDHTLATAPYPNQVMAFCGALSLQAFLAARKVRDQSDNRTNLYLLGLAHSSAGKDHPRKVNTRILHQVGLSGGLGDRFASGEGIQDALFVSPSMLFQTDEIDGMLQTINKAKDARYENVMGTLLTMYSAANSVFPMRRKAGRESPGVIDQPCLIVFGTAIPNHYYAALSERMLTNGFFARMLVLECTRRSPGQEHRIVEIPSRVLETARWWADFNPGSGNLQHWSPAPKIVEYSRDAQQVLIEARLEAEAEYAQAEEHGDPVGTTVWGRASEQTRKLALLYAISSNHRAPQITETAATWAARLIAHQTRRMLFMAQNYSAANPFHADCLRLLQKLREAPDRSLPHSVLLKRMKVDAQTFLKIVQTLSQQGDIETAYNKTAGRAGILYRLLTP